MKTKALVIGPTIIDTWVECNSNRIDQTSSVPVLDVVSSVSTPGGAANVVATLESLGISTTFMTVTGRLPKMLPFCNQSELSLEKLFSDAQRKPYSNLVASFSSEYCQPMKLRCMNSQGQLVARIDVEQFKEKYCDPEESALYSELCPCGTSKLLCATLDEISPKVIVISDYNKRVCNMPLISGILQWAYEHHVVTIVDPHPIRWSNNFALFAELASIISPNLKETYQVLGIDNMNLKRTCRMLDAKIRESCKNSAADVVLRTGDRGVSLLFSTPSVFCKRRLYPFELISHVNTVGAGDYFLAGLAAAHVLGPHTDWDTINLPEPFVPSMFCLEKFACTAMQVAEVGIQKPRTDPVFLYELYKKETVGHPERKITEQTSILPILDSLRRDGKQIGAANGVFDLYHAGHASMLQKARLLCDFLIVLVNSDKSAQLLKGEERPFCSLQQRMQVLSNAEVCDMVVSFDEETACQVIQKIRPHILFKGKQHRLDGVPEAVTMNNVGGQIYYLPVECNVSTSLLSERIKGGKGTLGSDAYGGN